jgi:hypothetical protein
MTASDNCGVNLCLEEKRKSWRLRENDASGNFMMRRKKSWSGAYPAFQSLSLTSQIPLRFAPLLDGS